MADGTFMDFGDGNPFGEPITRSWLADLELRTDFWNSTPQLQYIAHKAAAKKVSPWGLLALTQEHRATHVNPNVVLVPRDGVPGTSLVSGTSLNGFVGLVSPPGGGKSVTFQLAAEIMPPASIPVPDGTGQGMVRNLAKTETRTKDEENKPLPKPVRLTVFHRHEMMVHAPEVKSLNAEFMREGSKTDTIMRSLWVGETVGMNNADTDRRVVIPPNMVRVCGGWGVQPVNAVAILSQAADGTPQRFVWAPAQEYRTPYPSRTPPPQGVTFPIPTFTVQGPFGSSDMPMELEDGGYEQLPQPIWVQWSPKMHTEIAAMRAEIEALSDREPYERRTPEQRAHEQMLTMRAHIVLTTIKQAVKMGWIHGRPSPSDQDWDLARIQMDVSTAELAGVWQECAQAAMRVSELRGRSRAYEFAAQTEESSTITFALTLEISQRIFAELCKTPRRPRDIKRFFWSKTKRDLVNVALDMLEDQNRASFDGNLWWALNADGDRVVAESSVVDFLDSGNTDPQSGTQSPPDGGKP
jgi:hypothetical protein